MAKIVWPGGALLAPVPAALVTCGAVEKPNVLTVAWTGIVNSSPPKTYISLRPERYSYEIIRETGEFVINLSTQALARAADFCGVRSGRQVDKFEKMGLTALPSSAVSAPLLGESPLSLECRVFQTIELGSHTMFLADIVAVDVEDALVDEKGKLHLERADLISYAHGEYFALGRKLGTFGYTVRKKPLPGRNGKAKHPKKKG